MPRAATTTLRDTTRDALNLAWLIRLRFVAVAGQAVAVAVAHQVLGVPLPIPWVTALIAVELASNVSLAIWARRGAAPGGGALAGVIAFDVWLLTGLLYLTGGPFNPFSFVYLVYISLATVLLRARYTWMLAGLSLTCSALLFLDHVTLRLPATSHDEHMRWHLWGMWVAFGVAAVYIVYSQLRVLQALSGREAELAEARDRAARHERLVSLATLAGGAAHELASPLSTIAVIAGELERELVARNSDDDLIEDMRLVRTELAACRRILDQMSAQAGESAGEEVTPSSVEELVGHALDGIPEQPPLTTELGQWGSARLAVTRRALAQSLRVLVRNAQDASTDETPVTLTVDCCAAGNLRFEVRDRGVGMSSDVLARAGEPFFTPKPTGRGMGLGLFLCRAVVESLGGEIQLESRPGQGTTASIVIPPARWTGPAAGAGPASQRAS
jgi:two-component system sensor histidine kinase RegB